MKIYTDGSQKRVAYVFANDIGVIGQSIATLPEKATVNAAEYLAVIEALKCAEALDCRVLDIYSDSQLMVKQMLGEYQVRCPELQHLNWKVIELSAKFTRVKFHWIPREENLAGHLLEEKHG